MAKVLFLLLLKMYMDTGFMCRTQIKIEEKKLCWILFGIASSKYSGTEMNTESTGRVWHKMTLRRNYIKNSNKNFTWGVGQWDFWSRLWHRNGRTAEDVVTRKRRQRIRMDIHTHLPRVCRPYFRSDSQILPQGLSPEEIQPQKKIIRKGAVNNMKSCSLWLPASHLSWTDWQENLPCCRDCRPD